MSWFSRLTNALYARPLDHGLDEEIRDHIERRAADLRAAGLSAADAARQARTAFGNVTQLREQSRDIRLWSALESTIQDLRYAWRGLRGSPVFTLTAVASLALGIGAAVAIFTAADTLLFRPLPYREPERLVMVWETDLTRPEAARSLVSTDNVLDWQARTDAFEDVAVFWDGRSTLHDGDQADELHIRGVTANFFTMIGVQAVRGRTFGGPPSRTSKEAAPEVVISDRLWQAWYDRDPGVVGRTVHLDARPQTIIGVMPAGFSFGDREVDLWLPTTIARSGSARQGRDSHAVARLRAGASLAQAQTQMTTVARALEQLDPAFNHNWTVTLEPLRDAFVHNVKASLLILLGAVGLLLLVACANVANLLVARQSSRSSEMAIRAALGGGRWRLVRQRAIEGLLVAGLAGVAGLLLGRLALDALVAMAPQALTRPAEIAIDWRIVLFTAALAAASSLLFGLMPSMAADRGDLTAALRRAVRGGSEPTDRRRAWLISSEVALAVILLAGAALLGRSFVRLQAVDTGLQPGHVLTFHFRVPSPAEVGLFAQAIARIEALPGVRSVSAANLTPFDASGGETPVLIGARAPALAGAAPMARVRTITPRYFETLGIPVVQGRDFSAADNTRGAPLRFVVNRAFVRAYLGRDDPLATTISPSLARSNPFGEVIGVVGDVKDASRDGRVVPTVYSVYARLPYGQMTLAVRTEQEPMAIAAAVRQTIHDLDPRLPVAELRTMDEIVGQMSARERFSTTLMGGLALSAVLLAAIGVYGVLAYAVSQRTREIAVRLAIGAQPRRIVAMVLGDCARLVVPGLIAGVAGALAGSRALAPLLFDTDAHDPLALAIAPAVLLAVAIAAAGIPAWRAARLDPTRALRLG
ncbi:MAG: ABC transporter permease [Vicinamibacteraceae bacterium]